MFNIQPGTGLGYTGSKQIALGLGDSIAAALGRFIRAFMVRIGRTIEKDVQK